MLALTLLAFMGYGTAIHGKEDKVAVKESGVYIKTTKGLQRLLPNIVFDEKNVIYIERNNPPVFALKDFQFFVLSGKYDLTVLTLNPMTFFQLSPVERQRFSFGKDIPFDLKQQKGADTYSLKPKGLMGRGYYSLWINDTAWDFILD